MGSLLSHIDLTIIGLYFLVIMVLGIWVASRTKSGEDLFLGGRSLTWGMIGFSFTPMETIQITSNPFLLLI